MQLNAKSLSLAVRLLVTAGTIWYLLSIVDIDALGREFTRISLPEASLGIAIIALQPLFSAVRWKIVFSALNSILSLKKLVRITYIALFFNQILPAGVGGDVIRVVLARAEGSTLRDAISSTVLDRIFMLLVLITMFGLSQAFFSFGLELPRSYSILIGVLTVTLIAVLVVIALEIAPIWRLPIPFIGKLEGPANQARKILMNPKTLSLTVIISAISHINIMVCVYFFMIALGADVTIGQILMLMPIVLLAAVIPVSFGGWGVREAMMITVFAQLGIPDETSLSASLLVGGASVLITLPGLWFFQAQSGNIGFRKNNAVEKIGDKSA